LAKSSRTASTPSAITIIAIAFGVSLDIGMAAQCEKELRLVDNELSAMAWLQMFAQPGLASGSGDDAAASAFNDGAP
jgi:hypothetical protein